MMALIGFIFIFVLGFAAILIALYMTYISLGFSGKADFGVVIPFAAVGAWLLYVALTHSPILLTLAKP